MSHSKSQPPSESPLPPPPTNFLDAQIDQFADEATVEQKKALEAPEIRARVEAALKPALEDFSKAEQSSFELRLENSGFSSTERHEIQSAFIRDKIASTLEIIELEKKVSELEGTNGFLLAENEVLRDDNEELAEKVGEDHLTGLKNKRSIDDELPRMIELARRVDDMDLVCLVVDVDRFKDVNDSYGLPAGDQVLQEVAKRLQDATRTSDFVGRYGGEEFLVLMSVHGQGDLVAAERYREAVEGAPYIVKTGKKRKKLKITVSIGGTHLTEEDDKVSIVERADQFMKMAKKNGRNRSYIEGEYVDPDDVKGIPTSVEFPSRDHIKIAEEAS